MKVVYFFRKPFEDYFSIEEVFKNVQSKLNSEIEVKNYLLKRFSKGFFNRVVSCFEVLRQQGEINHITGDIHFISYLLPKSKTILTVHDLAPLKNSKGIKHLIIKLLWYQIPIWSVKYVTVISEFTKRELIQHLSINENKLKVIPNPVSTLLEYNPKTTLSTIPVLLQVGTAYNKNLEGLIKAIENVSVKLIIIGTLSSEQKDMLIEFNINYTNFSNLSYEEVVQCYVVSDIVCFASLYEGFGLPIIEAQSIGRAVITSNLCSMPEIAGEAAVLVTPSNIDAYRLAINELISNHEKRNELIRKGKLNAKRFSNETISNQYLDLYKSMYEESK